MNSKADQGVDAYIDRSENWPAEMAALRPLILDCGLTEEIKWGKPCFSHGDANIVIFQEMKKFLAVMFFKGALLEDPEGVLKDNGPNSRSAKRMCFSSLDDVERLTPFLLDYIDEALANEAAGLEVEPAPPEPLAAELQDRLANDNPFRAAFEGLTPGRQREYNLHFSGAKQAKTRAARVEKYAAKILSGRGFRDR